MPWINLKAPWVYVEGPMRSIGYPAGNHNVTNEIASAAKAQGKVDDGDADHSDAQDRVDGPEAGGTADSDGPGNVDLPADATD